MTTPTILPTGYAGNYTDYLKTKVDHSGAERVSKNTISVPAVTADGTIIGMVPFNKGAELSSLYAYITDIDSSTNVTFDIGYVYEDAVTNTSKTNAFLSASTVPQAGGLLTANTADPCTWTAAGNGWVTVKVNNATTTLGTLSFRIGLTYDQGGLSN